MIAFLRSVAAVLACSFACGASAEDPALCGGAYFPRSAAFGPTPHIALDVGGKHGIFLIDYGATKSTLWTRDDGDHDISATRDVAVGFPGAGTARFLLQRNPAAVAEGLAGILGTDVLARVTLQLREDGAWVAASACDPETLKSSGFRPIDQTGFFAAVSVARPTARPLVPVVFLRFGDVRIWAQIDSGYEDAPGSNTIDINQALFERLGRETALVPDGTLTVRTCEGLETRNAYRPSSLPLAITDENGGAIAQFDRYRLALKRRNNCGGIAGISEPAAQIGMSILGALGTVVFEPLAHRVWVRSTGRRP